MSKRNVDSCNNFDYKVLLAVLQAPVVPLNQLFSAVNSHDEVANSSSDRCLQYLTDATITINSSLVSFLCTINIAEVSRTLD